MKQFYSVLTAIAVLFATATSAQTLTVSSTIPTPAPAFGSDLAVNPGNGFMSTNTNPTGFNVFPKGQTTIITSPEYYYTSASSVINFKYNFTTSNAANTAATGIIKIYYGTQTITFPTSIINIASGGGTYYFTLNLASALPANTNFKIELSMAIPNSDKAVTANTLAVDANLTASGAPIILPVKLLNFSGALNKSSVQLQWLVAENETAQKFEIQRSTNGASFTTVSVIAASKKMGDESYSFSESVSSEKVMYRLKMYDNTSKAEYSKTLTFSASASAQRRLQVLTNPVKEKLVISFSNESSETAQVTIYDNLGRPVQKQNLSVSQGINTSTIALNSNYKSGLYVVELVTKGGKLSEKLIYSNQ